MYLTSFNSKSVVLNLFLWESDNAPEILERNVMYAHTHISVYKFLGATGARDAICCVDLGVKTSGQRTHVIVASVLLYPMPPFLVQGSLYNR